MCHSCDLEQIHYDAASPNQQRNAEVLSMANPPSVAEVRATLS